MVLFLKRVRLLRYMEMREPLGTKCSGRASQRRVSRNHRMRACSVQSICRASQRRVSRNDVAVDLPSKRENVAPRRGA